MEVKLFCFDLILLVYQVHLGKKLSLKEILLF